MLCWKGLWQNHGLFPLRSREVHHHTFPPHALLENLQERMLKTNLSPKPSWQAEIADAYALIVECDRALSSRSCRKDSTLLSSSPNQLLSHCITLESSTVYLVSRMALRMCILQSLHHSIIKSKRHHPVLDICKNIPISLRWCSPVLGDWSRRQLSSCPFCIHMQSYRAIWGNHYGYQPLMSLTKISLCDCWILVQK